MIEILKVVLLSIVEGITEWLPISSTGHMILLDEFIQLNMRESFKEMFFVVVQLGAIMAVVVLYWSKLFPFKKRKKDQKIYIDMDIMQMWFKVVVASIPAGIVGVLFDEQLNALFYNYQTIAIMLILFGVLFIVVENRNHRLNATMNSVAEITYQTAFIIGLWQMIAAAFPGTSRSGATIVGALIAGVSRAAATEFTFFLAVPAMAGASLLKLVKFGFAFTGYEYFVLFLGMGIAYLVSVIVIKFLLSYIKKNDFKPFGYYRIALGILVLLYFGLIK